MNESTPTSRATMNEESYGHFRRLGTSGLLLPPISLGFWHNFGRERFEGGFEHDVRERHHPLRPRQQLRPARGQRRRSLR